MCRDESGPLILLRLPPLSSIMSTAITPPKGSEPKTKEAVSHPCPVSCGATISGRDPHTLCIVCIGPKHTQASRANLQSCPHCLSMLERILEMRRRVAVANNQDPRLPATTPKPDVHQVGASTSLADMMDAESPVLPPQFEELDHRVLEDEDTECDANSDLRSAV